ncbi:MAG TPA: phosphate ABC transporter permease PstA, partial [Gammaproteobacteria bacterium]|nr:phosphate ABC transporter permease PstA [Gammaproteobacteria bacterium]
QFWPADIVQLDYREPDGNQKQLLGEIVDQEQVNSERVREMGYPVPEDVKLADRYLLKIGNREVYGLDFQWIAQFGIEKTEYPRDVIVVERAEWGNLYGFLITLKEHGKIILGGQPDVEEKARLERKHKLREQIQDIGKNRIGAINHEMERLRFKERGFELEGIKDPKASAAIEAERAKLKHHYERLNTELQKLYAAIGRDSLVARLSGGEEVEVPLANVVRIYRPNAMSIPAKLGFYVEKLGEFVLGEPREANTEGGIFPAIFGTVLMVIIMSIVVTPFGVVAAVYLHEYAKQGLLNRIIRIAVNNLAGVPSIVYGVFGLGFFVYFVGGNIDQWFFPEALPAPTLGTPGLLWSSLTLALLTVPVVIVATEEGLARVPQAIREGSLALGATQAETLWRTVMPMATPAMMTGLILAIARAAGEVAPLMLVGVVKLAPSLPLDGNFPFLHLDRKFMHLGFHIYDVGFQSPNVEAARPLVYATTLLLVLIIVSLNLFAIRIRNRLRESYSAADH